MPNTEVIEPNKVSNAHIQAPKPKKLHEADFTLTESAQVFNTVTPPVGTTREDMLQPIFWSHVASRLRPMTEIRAMPKDGAWYGLYLVLYADRTQAKVKELGFWPVAEQAESVPETQDYEVKWISPPCKFGVIRKADREPVKDGFASKEDATRWLIQYARTTAKK